MKVKFLMKKIGEKKVLLQELNNKEIADRVGHFKIPTNSWSLWRRGLNRWSPWVAWTDGRTSNSFWIQARLLPWFPRISRVLTRSSQEIRRAPEWHTKYTIVKRPLICANLMPVVTAEGTCRGLHAQVADVSKALHSVRARVKAILWCSETETTEMEATSSVRSPECPRP